MLIYPLLCVDAMIGFDAGAYDIFEDERIVNVTIVLNGRTDRSITVILNTQDGTAICKGERRDGGPVREERGGMESGWRGEQWKRTWGRGRERGRSGTKPNS